MNTNVTYNVRPAGRHLLTIGRELIQDNYAAVVELVKNAYDADSPNVFISFEGSTNQNGYKIIISDDGHGMSEDDVINKWLVPSTRDKLDRGTSPSGRILQGNKGIGRYAASILGNDLLLETVCQGVNTTVYIQWTDFESAKYLDDVDILVETKKDQGSVGTQLTISGNEEQMVEWSSAKFEKLRFELKKLTPPIIPAVNNKESDDTFSIHLKIEGFHGVDDVDEIVQPYPLLELFDYQICGKINKEGKGSLTYSSQRARNMVNEKIELDLRTPTNCGALELDIRVYDREPEAIDSLIKRGFKDESGNYVGKNQARQILNANNGIGVYRNGFRIRPLGDADFDWLKLNARRVDNPSMRIGSNQVIGNVHIQSERQSELKEKSARDGLRENVAFERLKDVTRYVIAELEKRRFEYRSRAGLSRRTIKVEKSLQNLFSYDNLKRDIETTLTKTSINKTTTNEIIKLINQEEEKKNKTAEELRRVVAIYQGQATLGNIIFFVLHEGRRHLNYFKNQIPNLKYWYELFENTENKEAIDAFVPIAEGVVQNAEFFVDMFNRLDPLAAGRQGPRKQLELNKAIKGAFAVFENELTLNDISYHINGSEHFKYPCWEQDIYAIFTNLIDNSIYWMMETNVTIRNISVDILIEGDSLECIDYRDTGPGIEPHHIESEVIFEPHFSTKPNGKGLGLPIAGESAQRNDLKLQVLESDDGVYFRLQPITEND